MTIRAVMLSGLLLGAACTAPLGASDLTITHVANLPLGATTTDQDGISFSVTGASGIAFLPDGNAAGVMDNSNRLLWIGVTYDTNGTLTDASLTGGLTLASSADYEDLAPTCMGSTILLAQEGGPGIRAIDPATGATLEDLPVPSVFTNRRANRGFEALTIAPAGTRLWTATEEALTVDGPGASPTTSSTVRLLRYDLTESGWAPGAQLAYVVEPMHGPPILGNGQSGLVALVALPSDRLLAVERSLAFAPELFVTRIYEIDARNATDVRDFNALEGAAFTPVTKTLVYQGSHQNLEGLALGPADLDGNRPLLGIIDDGDPLSTGALVLFRLSGLQPCETDGNTDDVTVSDLLVFLSHWFDGDASAELSGDCPATITVNDLLEYLACWFEA